MDTAEKEGIEIGIDKGEHKKSLEIAKTMMLKNFDIQTIMEITGLPENIITTL
jgi:predicted transposase/invertase (TIGR01784 family)